MRRPPLVLFHRKYSCFKGGHLKVGDYLGHVDSADWLRSSIFVDEESIREHPWTAHPHLVDRYDPESADVLFVAGDDWRALDAYQGIEERKPVINLIQHVRHADPDLGLYAHLSRKATRICVSAEVAAAIDGTGRCRGPIHVIENGIDMSLIPETRDGRDGVVIAGLKQPRLALELCDRLGRKGIPVECLTAPMPRALYLERIGKARIAVTLPNRTEGFYLPAIEAMAMGTVLVCPDCVGNRGFCIDKTTCLMPGFDVDSLEAAVVSLLEHPETTGRLQEAALKQSRLHDIRNERSRFLELLRNIAYD